MELKNSHVLVTGGAGFIGSWIAEAASASNDVAIFDDLSSGRKENLAHLKNVKLLEGDIRNGNDVEKAVKDVDVIFHEAAQVRVPRSVEEPVPDMTTNVLGTLNVLEACRKSGVRRLVYASSSSLYGDPARLPVSEDAQPNPMSPYAVSKLAAEYYVRLYSGLYGLKAVALRYFNVYGPRQDPSSPYSGVISIFIKNITEGRPLTVYGDGEQTRDFTSVRDVARANLLAAVSEKACGRAINVGSGQSVSLNGIIDLLGRISGKRPQVSYADARPGDVKHSCADMRLAKELLGFSSRVSLEEGLRELIGHS